MSELRRQISDEQIEPVIVRTLEATPRVAKRTGAAAAWPERLGWDARRFSRLP